MFLKLHLKTLALNIGSTVVCVLQEHVSKPRLGQKMNLINIPSNSGERRMNSENEKEENLRKVEFSQSTWNVIEGLHERCIQEKTWSLKEYPRIILRNYVNGKTSNITKENNIFRVMFIGKFKKVKNQTKALLPLGKMKVSYHVTVIN